MTESEIKVCPKHGETEFSNGKCKKCNYENLDSSRRKYKHYLIEYKGGKCEKCGKTFCDEVYDFHHINPEEKEFGISSFKILNFEKLKQEADKCMLLCANCHREIHAEIANKKRKERLLEEEENIKKYYSSKLGNCKVKDSYKFLPYDKIIEDIDNNLTKKDICEKYHINLKTLNAFFKENNISYRNNIKRVIPTKDELIEYIKKYSFLVLGRMFNVSGNAIKKWCIKYEIDYKSLKK